MGAIRNHRQFYWICTFNRQSGLNPRLALWAVVAESTVRFNRYSNALIFMSSLA